MNDQATLPATGLPRAKRKAPSKRRPEPIPAAADLGRRASTEAGRRAAALLEVLAGECTPPQAAIALGVSLPYFYLLERRALESLVSACEPRSKGPAQPDLERQLSQRERELERCRRECQRQAALVRVTQRAVGLPGLADNGRSGSGKNGSSPAGKGAGKGVGKVSGKRVRKRRRPVVRALRAARTLRENSSAPPPPAGTDGLAGSSGVASCVPSSVTSTRTDSSPKEDHDGR